jgi:hypothetical protein
MFHYKKLLNIGVAGISVKSEFLESVVRVIFMLTIGSVTYYYKFRRQLNEILGSGGAC